MTNRITPDVTAPITAKTAAMLAARHEAAADHFGKRRAHCIAAEFHRYTADVLRQLAAQIHPAA